MKKSSLAIFTALILGLFLTESVMAQYGAPIPAKEISAEEAAKKYPAPKGGYPAADISTAEGIVKSPYPPHRQFTTMSADGKSKVKRGALILDPYAKMVFINP